DCLSDSDKSGSLKGAHGNFLGAQWRCQAQTQQYFLAGALPAYEQLQKSCSVNGIRAMIFFLIVCSAVSALRASDLYFSFLPCPEVYDRTNLQVFIAPTLQFLPSDINVKPTI
ncbi:hypothetical protein CEXT_797941, partial [Caerostris extrusa]